mgnify:CR=1 FL=1
MRKASIHIEVLTEVGREDRTLHFEEPKAIHTYMDSGAPYIYVIRFGDDTWNLSIGGVNLYDLTDADINKLCAAINTKQKEKLNVTSDDNS